MAQRIHLSLRHLCAKKKKHPVAAERERVSEGRERGGMVIEGDEEKKKGGGGKERRKEGNEGTKKPE